MNRILSFITVFVAFGIVSILQASYAQAAATLYFTPAAATLTPGQTLSVTLMVNTGGEAVNALAAYFSYPANILEGVSVSTTGSVMTLFAEQQIGNGQVRISGGKPTPGFSGVQKIATLTFQAKSSVGTASLTWNADSAVLTDSGNANILSIASSGTGVYTIESSSQAPTPPPVSQPTSGQTQAPVVPEEFAVYDVEITAIGPARASVLWKTTENADARLEYARTGEEFNFIILKRELETTHRLLVEGLSPQESYTFLIQGRNEQGEEARVEEEFVFVPPQDRVEAGEGRQGIEVNMSRFSLATFAKYGGGIGGTILVFLLIWKIIRRFSHRQKGVGAPTGRP